MLRLPRRQKTMIGLSVLPESIYLVQFRHVKNDYEILHAAKAEMTHEWLQTGQLQAYAQLTKTLSAFVRDFQLQDHQTAICVPLNLVKMHSIVVPAGLAVRDVEAEVYAEAIRLLPTKHEKIAYDYQAQSLRVKEEKSVFLAATGESYLTRYAGCLRNAGLKPAVIEIDIFAMLRAARYVLNHMGQSAEKFAALYVTPHYGLIAARDGEELLFYKHWDEQSLARHQITLMQWVEWCCHAYRQAGIHRLGLSGTSEMMTQAAAVIKQHWDCDIQLLNPFNCMRMPAAMAVSDGESGLLACGLAMREPLAWLN